MIALKNYDFSQFVGYMSESDAQTVSRLTELDARLSAQERSALSRLYGMIHYTVGETAEGIESMTVQLELTIPDLSRIHAIADKTLLVTAQTAEAVILEMLESGDIEKNYMKKCSVAVWMTKEDGAWKLMYGAKENADLRGALYLSEMLTFLAGH